MKALCQNCQAINPAQAPKCHNCGHGIANGPLNAAACYVPPCDKCGGAQTQLGGIEFGPPMLVFDYSGKALPGYWCQKLHVCVKCTSAHNAKAMASADEKTPPKESTL